MARDTSGSPSRIGAASVCSMTFVMCFVAFLVIAVLGQLLAMPWRSWLPGAESERSILRGVSAAVYSCMSHIP